MKKITALVIIILTIQGCNLSTKDEKVLAEHNQSNGNKLVVYSVSVGATANDNIQVRQENQNLPIWVSEKYDTLLNSKLVNDTSLELVLGIKKQNNQIFNIDTLHLNIHKF